MQTFTYSVFFKIIFRFGNIFVTLLLLIYLIPVVTYIDQNMLLIIPAVISLAIMYIVNKVYLNYYKILSYKIEADEEKIICSDFLFSDKSITIYYKDIEELSGGIFDGKSSGMMKVREGKSKMQIGFSQKLRESGKLISLILSKVSKELYNKVIQNLIKKKHHGKPNSKH